MTGHSFWDWAPASGNFRSQIPSVASSKYEDQFVTEKKILSTFFWDGRGRHLLKNVSRRGPITVRNERDDRKRKTALAEFRVKLADMRKQKEKAKREKALADLRRPLQVVLVRSEAEIYSTALEWNLTIPKLHDQLNVFRLRGVPDIKANSNYSKKADKQAALVEALRKFQQFPESFPVPESVLARLLEPETAVVEYWADEEDIEMAD
ncbi:hypothetical protein B0H17DRAFT_1152489 [Mycena rosella]|uniref:Uncharacterized protein n=1 Tax=Mycena rosella TaxID=1033263 RepID=A0AAD7BDI4_MYCRO|nr:hypothetical protein B0H17DRAFT_1152489 [Mycena rosella]